MKIKACPRCGSRNISMGSIGDGVLFGIDSWKEVCRNCNYQGAPILFDSESEYNKFFKTVNQKFKNLNKVDNKSVDKSEEKEVKVSRKIFFISVILSVLINVLFLPNYIRLFDISMAILYIVGQILITSFTIFVLLLFLKYLVSGLKK